MSKYKVQNPAPTHEDLCIICNRPYAETHEVFFGSAYLRFTSMLYGAQERLCPLHHREGQEAVHRNKKFDDELKRKHQLRIMTEKDMTFNEWLSIFYKSYL